MRHTRTIVAAAAFAVFASPVFAAAPLTKVDVALGDVSINKVPFLIAADEGIFAKNGIEAHMLITPGAANAVRQSGVNVPPEFISADIGTAPFSVGGGAPMISGVGRNPNALVRVIVSTTENIFRSHLVAKPEYKSITDLKGKKIGTAGAGSVPHYGLLELNKQKGWGVEVVSGDENLDALKAGKVEAITASVLVTAMAPAAGYKVIDDFANYKLPLAGSGIMVETKYLAANRDTVARFVKAAVEATAMMKKNKAVFNAALAKWFNVKDPKVQEEMYKQVVVFPNKPYPSIEGVKGAMDVYTTDNLKKHKPEDFYDSTFITALDKSGYLDQISK